MPFNAHQQQKVAPLTWRSFFGLGGNDVEKISVRLAQIAVGFGFHAFRKQRYGDHFVVCVGHNLGNMNPRSVYVKQSHFSCHGIIAAANVGMLILPASQKKKHIIIGTDAQPQRQVTMSPLILPPQVVIEPL
ncbi:hypothetical protein [Candidatus Amarobacter glycogenicus]|uniref:hypothetical protein n=1 Tax=Candidatus Amarobacter glycogenicus TaxID=3140699 RepID=UPI002A17E629|nr:hypothetical protein [Dehalococcoidia bacterium]